MRILLCLLISLLGLHLTAQTVLLKKDNLSCVLPNQNDRQTGVYQSFYPNGQKKSEGKLENGLRVGKWSIWDSTGTKLVERFYENPWCFNQQYPKVKPNATAKLFASTSCERERDSSGVIPYVHIAERAINWSKRLWSEVSETNNPEFFKENSLWQTMYLAITTDSLKMYSEDWKSIQFQFDPKSMQVVGFELKEDLLFDTERMISEIRTISIQPIIVSKSTGKRLTSFQIYFPHLRKFLAKKSVVVSTNKEIQNLDDLFLYRYFTSSIVKESNINDLPIAAYTTSENIPAEQQRIIIESLETEHDWWIAFRPQ